METRGQKGLARWKDTTEVIGNFTSVDGRVSITMYSLILLDLPLLLRVVPLIELID